MTRDEFQRWKHDGKEVWEVVKGKIRELEYVIAREAGNDSHSDKYKSGVLKGMELVLEIDWEEEEDAENQRA